MHVTLVCDEDSFASLAKKIVQEFVAMVVDIFEGACLHVIEKEGKRYLRDYSSGGIMGLAPFGVS